ncbi:MAG: hypothetical protein AAGA46_00395 [Cyanobacteria bacterium P01_F01_bin.13]
MATWRGLIKDELNSNSESWEDIVSTTLTEQDLDREFDDSYGGAEGCPFTLWTHKRVYFPTEYDGAEGVKSAPRNPSNEKTEHV